MIRICKLMALLCVLTLAACDQNDLSPAQLPAICNALGGHIAYNSTNAKSLWYAAQRLAPTLAERNRIGHNLHCPGF